MTDSFPPPSVIAPLVAFIDVNILTMLRPSRLLERQTVLAEQGRITQVGPSHEIPIPPQALRIPGSGQSLYLMPGLIDMHVHLDGSWDAPLYLAAGVTAVRNMAGSPRLLELRREQIEGERSLWASPLASPDSPQSIPPPRIFTAGPILDGLDSQAAQACIVQNPEEAAQAVRDQIAEGYDFVKVYDSLSYEAYAAIIATAREIGISVAGHVPRIVRLRRALRLRQDCIEHLSGYADPIESPESLLRGRWHWRKSYLAIQTSEERMERVAEATAHAGTWNCPTLVVAKSLFREPENNNDSRVPQKVSDAWREQWLATRNLEQMNRQALEEGAQVRAAMVKALHRAGARLVAGSDAPNHGMAPGASLLDELAELERAGLDRFEVLQMATADAAEMLGASRQIGSIDAGHHADLILLEANPLDDLRNLSRKVGVMAQSRWYPMG